ncbi:MAG TPA: hypothetical protein VFQ53_11270 [Kofleriaceae bacterium]|nr:hypothetical protein [Kofleriaceae bacterium]
MLVSAANGRVRDHLVQHDAEREHVGAAVDRLARELLGRHVAGRADHHAGRRPRRVDRGRLQRRVRHRLGERGRLGVGRVLVVGRQLRDAEVEDLDAAIAGQEQVVGLDVAMDDVGFVRRREPARDLGRDLQGLADRQRSVEQPVAQRLAAQQLGDEVRRAVVPTDVVQRQQVRMIERAGGPRFLLEPAQPLVVTAMREDLDRDRPAEPRIGRAIHLAHATSPDRALDLVVPQPCTEREAHRPGIVYVPGGSERTHARTYGAGSSRSRASSGWT